MKPISRRIFGVTLLTAVLTASCGGGQGGSATDERGAAGAAPKAEEFPEPPDGYERLGMGPRPDPIQWLRTTGDGGDRILYYEDVVGSYGDKREITIRAALTMTENSATQASSYQWREIHRKIDIQNKSISDIKTDQGSGTVVTETVRSAKYGPLTVYRLKGDKPEERFRTWVLFGRQLYVPQQKIEESEALGTSVMWIARATPHVLEVTEFADEVTGYRLGLKRDDGLIIRLQRDVKSRAAVLKEGTQGTQLVLTKTTTEPAFGSGQLIDLYHFTAKSPGWADLQFDNQLVGTFRVRVE